MALDERRHIYGNTVVNPEIEKTRKKNKEEIKRIEESKLKYRKQNIRNNNKLRVNTILTLCFVAIISFFTIYRSSNIYSLQNEYLSLQSETRIIKNENEALRSELINASSLGDMMNASKKLNLVKINKDKSLVLDLNKNNFEEIEDSNENNNLFEKAISLLSFKSFK